MPDPAKLPESLRDLAFQQATVVRGAQDFRDHVNRLVRAINKLVELGEAPPAPPDRATDPDAHREPAKDAPPVVPAAPAIALPATPTASAPPPPQIYDSPRDRHLFGPGPKSILSIDGGAVRVVVALAFLERIEKLLSERAGRRVLLSEHFDLVGATSASGLLSTTIALDHTMSEVKQRLFDFLPRMFKPSWGRLPFFQPKFDDRKVREELEDFVGHRSLGSRDLVTGLCVLMKRTDTGSLWVIANNPRYPYWNTPDDNSFIGNRHFPLAKLVRASMAAPFYFEPEALPIIQGAPHGQFVDGSLSLHNNPALALYLLATLKSQGLAWRTGADALTITSIGVGSFRQRPEAARGWGKHLALTFGAIASMFSEAQDFVLAQMQMLGTSEQESPVNFLNGRLDGRPLGGPYFRFRRYDVQLETNWLRETLDMNVSDSDLERFRRIDDPNVAKGVYDLACVAAEKLVKPDDWQPR